MRHIPASGLKEMLYVMSPEGVQRCQILFYRVDLKTAATDKSGIKAKE